MPRFFFLRSRGTATASFRYIVFCVAMQTFNRGKGRRGLVVKCSLQRPESVAPFEQYRVFSLVTRPGTFFSIAQRAKWVGCIEGVGDQAMFKCCSRKLAKRSDRGWVQTLVSKYRVNFFDNLDRIHTPVELTVRKKHIHAEMPVGDKKNRDDSSNRRYSLDLWVNRGLYYDKKELYSLFSMELWSRHYLQRLELSFSHHKRLEID